MREKAEEEAVGPPFPMSHLDGTAGRLVTWWIDKRDVHDGPSQAYLEGYRTRWIKRIQDTAARRLHLWELPPQGPVSEPHRLVARRLATLLDAEEKLWRAARRLAERELKESPQGSLETWDKWDARAKAIKAHPRVWKRCVTAQLARVESFKDAPQDWLAVETYEVASYALAARDAWHVEMIDEWLEVRANAMLGDKEARQRLTKTEARTIQRQSARKRSENSKLRNERAVELYVARRIAGDRHDEAAKSIADQLGGLGRDYLVRALGGKKRLEQVAEVELAKFRGPLSPAPQR